MKILREPLLHFLLLGAAIFGAYRLRSDARATEPGNIVVMQGRIEALVAAFTRTWQRPPTASEREGLIRDYILEEVYVREAIALGLDQDDMVIRRRLRQKLEFVSEGLIARAEPTDYQLHAYLTTHPDAFRIEPRFTFRQVFLSPHRRGEKLSRDATRLLAELQRDADPDTLGDSSLLDHQFEALPASQVAAQFGDEFAAALSELPTGQWSGPVASTYGMHLVLVGDRAEGRVPVLEEVRDVVRRDWTNAQQTEASEKFYQALLQRYTVIVEQSAMATETKQRTQTLPMRPWLVVLAILFFPPVASAHEVRPAYLQIRQTGPDTYDVLWKVPGRGDGMRLGIYVELPSDCVRLGELRTSFVNNAFTERWSVRRAGGLTGAAIHIAGLSATMTDVLVRIERLDGTTQVVRLTPARPSVGVEAEPTPIEVAGTYTRLGIEHILAGVDHLLYVLAMLLLVTGWKRVVATMTAFTATHSLTLTAATLGWFHVPQPPVEAGIALSIVFVAREIARSRKGVPGLTERWPWLISFTFGLLHGFGFAGALSEVGLPQAAIPVALLFFNVGVEIGQLLFIAAVVAALVFGRRAMRRFAPRSLPT